jgi:hypothetical protein
MALEERVVGVAEQEGMAVREIFNLPYILRVLDTRDILGAVEEGRGLEALDQAVEAGAEVLRTEKVGMVDTLRMDLL